MCVDVLEARTGDMSMGRNLRAARCLDFTDKDDDDGLNRAVDSDCEDDPENYKKKDDETDDDDDDTASVTSIDGDLTPKKRGVIIHNGNRLINSNTFPRRNNLANGQKRPLSEGCVVAACQEIKYLDISYQKVATVMVQFTPIPQKKISYLPVLHSHIHYCDVSYIAPGEKDPTSTTSIVRRKLQRSHSFAAFGERGLRERLKTQPFIRSEWASGISRERQCLRAAAVAVSTECSR